MGRGGGGWFRGAKRRRFGDHSFRVSMRTFAREEAGDAVPRGLRLFGVALTPVADAVLCGITRGEREGWSADGQGGYAHSRSRNQKVHRFELGCYFVDCRVRGAPLLWMTRAARSRRWSARLMNGITEFMLRRDNAILGVGSRRCGWYAAVQCPPPNPRIPG